MLTFFWYFCFIRFFGEIFSIRLPQHVFRAIHAGPREWSIGCMCHAAVPNVFSIDEIDSK